MNKSKYKIYEAKQIMHQHFKFQACVADSDTYLEQKQTFHIMVNNVSESHSAFKCRSVI